MKEVKIGKRVGYWFATMLVAGLAVLLVACGGNTSSEFDPNALITKGPFNEAPVAAGEIQLTDAQKEQVRAGNYTAALLWHTEGAFTDAVESGARDTLMDLGIKVDVRTSAEFDAAKQAANVETALASDPDAILTLLFGGDAAATAYQPAVDAGVKLVLLSNPVPGFVHGRDYVGIVTDDLAAMGIEAAKLMANAINGQGKIGYIFHDADYYVTNSRDQAFKAYILKEYPNIEIVAEQGLAFGEGAASPEEIAQAMLTRNSDLDGIYAPWSAGPATGVLGAVRAANSDASIITIDLDDAISTDLANNGNVAGIVADEAYNIGATMAREAALALIGESVPPFVVVPAFGITRDNLRGGYLRSFQDPAPQVVLDALN